ncbi:MAG TPA: hypothetical protein VLA98_06430, partial [Solirubrobacteraceae bacterium]|nr:hypothetical protein [Solirubrobacteraceae bacterium]
DRALARIDAPGNAARAESDFRAARLLNPDTTPDLRLALLHRARGDFRRGVTTARNVTRREPDNLRAWAVLLAAAVGHDAAAVRDALAARRRLDPIDAR